MKLQKEVENLMEIEPGTNLICLGDFNGRLSRLEPEIITDTNGKMLENWTTNLDLNHLNITDQCSGTFTFCSKNGKSAIDHVLVNGMLLENYLGMHIDEDRVMLNISDHSLVRVWFRIGSNNESSSWKKTCFKNIKWVARDEKSMMKFEAAFIPQIGKKISFRRCMNKLKTTLNTTLRKKKRIKVGGKGSNKLLAAEWVDEELIRNIKLRTNYSREWKKARKNKSPPEHIEQCKRKYMKQQHITSKMSGDKKSAWEQKKIEETKNNGKKFWTMIKELLGKNKEIVDEAYVYTDEGQKKEIKEFEDEYSEEWRKSIYQKYEKTDFSFWYGGEGERGLRDIMIEELKQGNSGIMENPSISEEEFIKVIKNMKNGKASGVDDITAELMKHLIKNGKIRNYLVKCFNKALTEEIHEDWLLSKTTMIPKNNKPKIMEHRPIAVTVNSSKIICTILRKK